MTKGLNPWSALHFSRKPIDALLVRAGQPWIFCQACEKRQGSSRFVKRMPRGKGAIFMIDEIAALDPGALRLQTGYLAIKSREAHGIYRLGQPNLEVASRFAPLLMSSKPPDNPIIAKRQADETCEPCSRWTLTDWKRPLEDVWNNSHMVMSSNRSNIAGAVSFRHR